jgi:YgiT-type zinc finger domain-containing protein
MKTCYHCGGEVERKVVDVKIGGATITDIYAEVCQRCNEKYFDSKTATFIQKVASFIKHQKREYLVDMVKGISIKE